MASTLEQNIASFTNALGSSLLAGSGPSGRAAFTSLTNQRSALRARTEELDLRRRERENNQLLENTKLRIQMSEGLLTTDFSNEPNQEVMQGVLDVTRKRLATDLLSLGFTPEGAEARAGSLKPVIDADKGFTLAPGAKRFDAAGNEIASAPVRSKLLTPEELDQKKEIAAAGRTEINILDKVPTIDQMSKLVGPDGETPELGETLGDLKDKGFVVRSTADQKTEKQAAAARATLDTLDKLANPVFTGQEGVENRLLNDAVNTWNRIGQTDKDLALFEAFSQGTVASLVRGVGEKGSLSNKDIERGLNLIPNSGKGVLELPDTREVAKGKMKQLREWFDSALGGKVSKSNSDSSAGELSDDDLLKGF